MLTLEDLKVGETYTDNNGHNEVIKYLGERFVISECFGVEGCWDTGSFLKNHNPIRKEKTKWYRVSFKLKSSTRADTCLELYHSKSDFLLNRCSGRNERDFDFINMELVYEE